MFARAETVIADAKIAQMSERGFVLKINSESVPVDDDGRTKFWKGKVPAKRADFHEGDVVHVRLKKDATPVLLREMADPATAKWLDGIRKNYTGATIIRIETKRLFVTLEDKSEFNYAISDKTKVDLKGVIGTISDLKEGMKVEVKAQLTPTLDTRATVITDHVVSAAKTGKGKTTPTKNKVKPIKLANEGAIGGKVVAIAKELNIIDVDVAGTVIHVTLSAQTKVIIGTSPGSSASIQVGDTVDVSYKRDKYGRFLASKINIHRP